MSQYRIALPSFAINNVFTENARLLTERVTSAAHESRDLFILRDTLPSKPVIGGLRMVDTKLSFEGEDP